MDALTMLLSERGWGWPVSMEDPYLSVLPLGSLGKACWVQGSPDRFP